jgi:hypothetical protein
MTLKNVTYTVRVPGKFWFVAESTEIPCDICVSVLDFAVAHRDIPNFAKSLVHCFLYTAFNQFRRECLRMSG